MTDNGIVNIHGKEYVIVARRVELAHEDGGFEMLNTELLGNDPVIVKATVTIKGKSYTGISAVNLESGKAIERANPYEVAETSAVGRALGFAGYGIVEGIASADEMVKSDLEPAPEWRTKSSSKVTGIMNEAGWSERPSSEEMADATPADGTGLRCQECGKPAVDKRGVSSKTGKPWHAIFCSSEDKSHAKFL